MAVRRLSHAAQGPGTGANMWMLPQLIEKLLAIDRGSLPGSILLISPPVYAKAVPPGQPCCCCCSGQVAGSWGWVWAPAPIQSPMPALDRT